MIHVGDGLLDVPLSGSIVARPLYLNKVRKKRIACRLCRNMRKRKKQGKKEKEREERKEGRKKEKKKERSQDYRMDSYVEVY